MNILLCDDDLSFMTEFEKYFDGFPCHVYKFTSPQAVKESSTIFDIAFLDIVFNENTFVFDLVDYLRNKNPKCIINFVTNHIKFAPDGYEYKAFRYILKNEPKSLILRRVGDVFREYGRVNALIKGSYKGVSFSVSPRDVYYIEIFNHILRLYTSKGIFEMYAQISDLYSDLLKWGFVRCHRSYIVNLNFVSSAENCFILNNPEKTEIPLGIRYKNDAKEKYFNYTGENL